MEGNSDRNNILTGFASYAHLLRFCLAVAFILLVLVAMLWVVLRQVEESRSVRISFNKQGATEIYVGRILKNALIVVPPNQLWVNTGLPIDPGATLRISATGAINLAMHRLSEAAQTDTQPHFGWWGPEGGELENHSELYAKRKQLLVNPKARYGMLLAHVKPEGSPEPGKENPRPRPIDAIGQQSTIKYKDDRDRKGILYLTVNDTVLDHSEDSEKAYVGNQGLLDETYGKGKYIEADVRASWRKLVAQQYWDIWYNDNIGHFLVEVVYE